MNVVREENRFSSFPDVVVRCGPPLRGTDLEMTDPTACFEVLSPSTRHLDQGEKLFAYQQMPSLQHVALIFPDEYRVEGWARADGGFEPLLAKRREEALVIPAFGFEIPLTEIYDGVEIAD